MNERIDLQPRLCSVADFGQAFRAGSSAPRNAPFAYITAAMIIDVGELGCR